MIKHLLPALLLMASSAICVAQQPKVSWDAHSLIMDGHRVMPVMGEIHYSRIPEAEWAKEIKKMKEGGVTMIATYVFWNHVEEQEGIFNWSGQRDLRHFIELCAKEDIPVVLRLGPFCHGEVRNGGIPDWVFTKGCKTRDDNPVFMSYVKKLYRQIFAQVQGLQWKDGGPLIAVQFDNEQRNGAYLMALKKIAIAQDGLHSLALYLLARCFLCLATMPTASGSVASRRELVPIIKLSTSKPSAVLQPSLPTNLALKRLKPLRATTIILTSLANLVAVWLQPIIVDHSYILRMPTLWL